MYTNRQEKILKYLSEVRSARVDQLADEFNMSVETIRRDLIDLEQDGYIQRTRGGATFNKNRAKELDFDKKLASNQAEKVEIAKLVCKYIDDGDAIAIGNGSCNIALARHLAQSKENLTIVTNSYDIANLVNENPSFTVFVACGILRKHNRSIVGTRCIDCLDQFRVDKGIINVDGLSISDGITQYNLDEAAVAGKLVEIAHTKIILAQSSKFDTIAFSRVCNSDAIDYIFTDWGVSAQDIKKWSEAGVKVLPARRT